MNPDLVDSTDVKIDDGDDDDEMDEEERELMALYQSGSTLSSSEQRQRIRQSGACASTSFL